MSDKNAEPQVDRNIPTAEQISRLHQFQRDYFQLSLDVLYFQSAQIESLNKEIKRSDEVIADLQNNIELVNSIKLRSEQNLELY